VRFTDIDGEELHVRFIYGADALGTRFTECIFCKGDDIVSAGIARCHPRDNFCRRVGRKFSFKYAIINLFPDRGANLADRRSLWHQFRRRFPEKSKGGR
jgi:hypothetical protein